MATLLTGAFATFLSQERDPLAGALAQDPGDLGFIPTCDTGLLIHLGQVTSLSGPIFPPPALCLAYLVAL